MDEGLIDYVAGGSAQNEENSHAVLNVIATPKFNLSGAEVDTSTITSDLNGSTLHEADGI